MQSRLGKNQNCWSQKSILTENLYDSHPGKFFWKSDHFENFKLKDFCLKNSRIPENNVER